jgi:hypothetical protein
MPEPEPDLTGVQGSREFRMQATANSPACRRTFGMGRLALGWGMVMGKGSS